MKGTAASIWTNVRRFTVVPAMAGRRRGRTARESESDQRTLRWMPTAPRDERITRVARSPHAELQLRRVAHLVLFPRRLEDDVQAHVGDAVDAADLVFDLPGQPLGGGAVGR